MSRWHTKATSFEYAAQSAGFLPGVTVLSLPLSLWLLNKMRINHLNGSLEVLSFVLVSKGPYSYLKHGGWGGGGVNGPRVGLAGLPIHHWPWEAGRHQLFHPGSLGMFCLGPPPVQFVGRRKLPVIEPSHCGATQALPWLQLPLATALWGLR